MISYFVEDPPPPTELAKAELDYNLSGRNMAKTHDWKLVSPEAEAGDVLLTPPVFSNATAVKG